MDFSNRPRSMGGRPRKTGGGCYKVTFVLYLCNTLCLSTLSGTMVLDRQRRATADEGRLRTGKEGDEYAAAGVPGCSRGRGCACTTNRCCCCVDSRRPDENLSVATAAAAPVLCLLVEGSVLN